MITLITITIDNSKSNNNGTVIKGRYGHAVRFSMLTGSNWDSNALIVQKLTRRLQRQTETLLTEQTDMSRGAGDETFIKFFHVYL